MATLNSPGVSVSVIDESFYLPSAPGTTPMVFVTSAQDKTNPSGTTALGTTAANAGKVWIMTSQRDISDTFGTPLFYTDSSGNAQHGNELNEYGLQAAYSVLGVSSRVYVVRADINTTALVPTSSIPEGGPVNGTYWVDTASSTFGVKEWNSSTQAFSVKTPIVLNDDNTSADDFSGLAPSLNIGVTGDYCMVVKTGNANKLYYRSLTSGWIAVANNFDTTTKKLQISSHYSYPDTAAWVTGSVWITTTTPTSGANWKVKRYNSLSKGWDTVTAPLYSIVPEATKAYDPAGGKNIAVGTLFVEPNYENAATEVANFKLWRRQVAGATTIVSAASNALTPAGTYTFRIRETLANSSAWGSFKTCTITPPNTTTALGSLIPAAILAQGFTNVSATYNSTTKQVTITHALGGDFELQDLTATPLATSGFTTSVTNLYAAPTNDTSTFIATNWKALTYEASANDPTTTPADSTLWYSSVTDEVDIMYHNGTIWQGYKTAFPATSPNGPIVSATEPDKDTGQSDGTALVAGDIWVSTADMDRYGKDLYVYDTTAGWVLQDTTDQSSPTGWLFADARWANTGTTLTASSISTLLTSNYVDPDAPDPAIYPKGMHLFNTRRSGFNVKKYISGHIDLYANDSLNTRYGNENMVTLGYQTDRWVSQNNVAEDGSGVFGRHAQRAQIVQALKSTIDTNALIRDTDTINFNLIATPGYPEAIQNMIGFNTDRGITAFVVGDTPFRLEPNGTALTAWGNNTAGAFDNGDDGATSYDEYMAMYYPSGYTNDNTGNYIVVPPSHMMLRTIINSDAKSFQWFAPAGTRRGGVDNATSVGYITGEGEFKTAALHQGLRDVLDDVKINPIATLTGVGVLAYGQRTRARNASSLDRINVARLVCYLRRQLDILARPFLFEPNDAQTRREIKAAAESLMQELVGQRALYDYIVVCDTSNNTPARIDRSELYMDIAIEPVKAVEFIYIPLRLKNTGDIKAGL